MQREQDNIEVLENNKRNLLIDHFYAFLALNESLKPAILSIEQSGSENFFLSPPSWSKQSTIYTLTFGPVLHGLGFLISSRQGR